MTGLTQLLNIGASGLNAATEGMQTVSNNTTNVNTPGYNLETVNQVELPGSQSPAGGTGNGADVTSVQRAFDQYVFQEIVGATATNSAAQVVTSNAQILSAIFPVASGGANGLGSEISTFFGDINTVAQDPASLPNRQVLLGDTQSLVSLFNSVGSTLTASLTTQNQQIGSTVAQINTLAGQIATLNQTIMGQVGSSGSAANSLLDQQDELVQQLSQQLGVTVVEGNSGAVDVYAAGGTALVNDGNAYNLAVTSGSYADGSVAVTYGPTGQDITQSLSGGQLGGLVTFRGQLQSAADSIGALAAGLADAVNGQQAKGLDLNGGLGQALFTVAGPTVYAAAGNTGTGTLSATIASASTLTPDDFIVTRTAGGYEASDLSTGQVTALGSGSNFTLDGMNLAVSGTVNVGDSFKVEPTQNAAQSLGLAMTDPNGIAAASPYVATAGAITSAGTILDQNLGNVAASIGGAVASGALPAGTVVIPAADFGQTLTLKFTSATSFNVVSSGGATIASGGFSPTSGAEIAVQYPATGPAGEATTITLSPGTAAAGDSFVLSPGGPGSNGNIAAMATLGNANLVAGQSLDDFYGGIVTRIGNQGQEAQLSTEASQGVLTSAQAMQQSISGVNLDQQAAQLVAYQQAYQASAQLIATAQSLFDSLITAVQAS
ncbi:MAG: flagellar hook-associated protein FlgK [Stellaceae bacterium]